MAGKLISCALGAFAVFAVTVSSGAKAGGSFPAAVEKVLMNQQTGIVSRMKPAKKRKLVSCVQGVLSKLPAGKKRYVQQAANYKQMERRFGEVVMANRAEWKQKIAFSCARIALA